MLGEEEEEEGEDLEEEEATVLALAEALPVVATAAPAEVQAAAEITMLKVKYPKAIVHNFETHIPKLYLPDQNDVHVLAAAIESNTNIIVTLNLKDFPNSELVKYGIRAVHPDELLYKEALDNFELISNLVGTILNDFNSSEANKINEYRLLKKANLNRLSKLFR